MCAWPVRHCTSLLNVRRSECSYVGMSCEIRGVGTALEKALSILVLTGPTTRLGVIRPVFRKRKKGSMLLMRLCSCNVHIFHNIIRIGPVSFTQVTEPSQVHVGSRCGCMNLG